MTAPDDLSREIARVAAAEAVDAAAMVLAMPWPQTRAVLAALGPWHAARLLLGVRADRVADLLDHIEPDMLSVALAYLSVPQIAEMLPLVPMESAVRVMRHLPPVVAEQLLLALPTQHRLALQEVLPPPVTTVPVGAYLGQAEQAVRRTAGTASWLDPARSSLMTEVFGRPVQVVVRDRPGSSFAPADLHAAIGEADWSRVAGLLVLTNAVPDPGLSAALREARQHRYAVEVVQWQDERDDGALKRALVRFSG